nr:MLPL2 [Nepeta sibirica]
MASKLEVEIELKTHSENLWKNLKEFITFFPKALPNMYEKIDVIEGDGRSVGSVFVSTLKPSELNPVVEVTKERIELLDEEKKILSYSFVEGEILKNYKNFRAIIRVSRSKSDGTIVNYLAEFEKANAEVPNPDFFKDYVAKLFHDVDDYLLKE